MGNAMNDAFENRACVEPENFLGETAQARQTKLNQIDNFMNDLNPSRKPAAWTRSGGLLALMLLADLPGLLTPLRADNPPTFLFQLQSPGGGNGQLYKPEGIAIDSGNNVYVADSFNNRILKFDGNDNYLTQWNGVNEFDEPLKIAVDRSNNVEVLVFYAPSVNYLIEKFDANGNYLTNWGYFFEPNGIATDSSNNVYTSDPGYNDVEKFTSNGTYLTQLGSSGSGNGQLAGPNGVAVDSSNNVYVVDSGNYRIEKFDSNGNYLTQWGSQGTGNGQFEQPDAIALDSSNNVYVVDEDNVRVEKFTSNGTYLTQWGSQGTGNGQFNTPQGIAVGSTGNFIYVADYGNSRIEVFINNPNIVAPIITNQPASQTVPAGANVTFSVGVIGTAPFAYQWSSNSIAIFSATNATFTLTDVSFADSASYSMLVTNSFGSELSSNAMLTVLPAVAMTQPASSVTTTGAVLNGSVTLGSDETVVWFDWGTDTNYGNIAGETVVPGNNGSNNLSITLSGLPGNIYHYRIDAANDFGIVYGNDQSFRVGFAPTATTLEPMNSTNGATLNATVNPNGWDTTVYFKWGVQPDPQQFNAADGCGRGCRATECQQPHHEPGSGQTIQLSGSGLEFPRHGIRGTGCLLQPPVCHRSQRELGFRRCLRRWPRFGGGGEHGLRQSRGPIFISTNSGANWALATGAPTNGLWETVACSADGSKMIAAGGGGVGNLFPIYTSPDMGVTWVSNNAPVFNWQSVASSADGTRLVAAAELNQVIYISTNSGVVWTKITNAPVVNW